MKPSIPSGTRDFSPVETARRTYIFDAIRGVFKTFGFQQIETPALENLSTLLGKYGEEGDKLLFKILNSGDAFSKLLPEDLPSSGAASLKVCEKGLRYDLTVPFARYVVQHRGEIVFPFRRYQIQPVWRADRPQKGRYREFYQCDVDIVGSPSLLNEVELMQIVDAVYQKLGIAVTLKINNRKVLSGIAELMGASDKLMEVTLAIDKIEKIGLDGVKAELMECGISDEAIATLEPILLLSGSSEEKLQALSLMLENSAVGMEGIQELSIIWGYLQQVELACKVELDLSLARGLSYYTGAIFEVKANDVEMGSITGGGRYDNLTGIFGLPDVSGVGISFGADRIYDVMLQLNLFPDSAQASTQVMFTNLGVHEVLYAIPLAARLRKSGVSVEIYPDRRKLQKQFDYANRHSIPYVVIAGDSEISKQNVSIKNLKTGEQQVLPVEDILNFGNAVKQTEEAHCPRCNSKDVEKRGKNRRGISRLRCKDCGKNFQKQYYTREQIAIFSKMSILS
ncbi:MAG: histidine--tRNA ligase [Prevotellaceae bacterium]|jgi:histidyl-tRNA synthetase|nr:histidine--tRNA ligase [Prevotellaceae bacterium]